MQLWNLVISRKLGRRVSTRYLSRVERKCGVFNTLRNSLAQAKHHRTEATKGFRKVKKQAPKFREKYLDRLARLYSEERNITAKQALLNLMNREKSRDSARRIKTMNKKLNANSALMHVGFFSDDGKKHETSDK